MKPWTRLENLAVASTTVVGAAGGMRAGLLGYDTNGLVVVAVSALGLAVMNFLHLEARRKHAEAEP